MLPNGTTFQAALLELGRATPLVPLTQEHSANSSYAPSSINGPEEVPQRVSGLSALDGKNVVPAVTKGVAAPVDGLPRIGTTASGGDVQAFVSLEAEEAGHEGLGLPVISRQDVQTIRDILLGKIRAPNHVSAGVGNGGFISLAPEWQQ